VSKGRGGGEKQGRRGGQRNHRGSEGGGPTEHRPSAQTRENPTTRPSTHYHAQLRQNVRGSTVCG
jgi:hypothetical protein